MGNPLFMDKVTAIGERIAYVRCFVEIHAHEQLQSKVSLEVKGEAIEIDIDYEVYMAGYNAFFFQKNWHVIEDELKPSRLYSCQVECSLN